MNYYRMNRVKILSITHNQTPFIYNQSKMAVCLSIDEGGPVGTIEALACGCHVLTHQFGFANDLKKDFPYEIKIIPFFKNKESYVQLIEKYINDYQFKYNENISDNLKDFEFESLSKILLEINKIQ